jgi:hypothetical protein
MKLVSSCDSEDIIPVSAAAFGSFEKEEGGDETRHIDKFGRFLKEFGGSRQSGHITGS